MRNRLAIIIFFVMVFTDMQVCAGENWTFFGTNRMLDSYYDSGSVRRYDDQKMEVLIKQSYSDREKAINFFKKFGVYDENLEKEVYKTALMVIDCENRMIGVRQASSFGPGGVVISSVEHDDPNFVFIREDSLFDLLYYEVCRSEKR
jgi:hypothetical protein